MKNWETSASFLLQISVTSRNTEDTSSRLGVSSEKKLLMYSSSINTPKHYPLNLFIDMQKAEDIEQKVSSVKNKYDELKKQKLFEEFPCISFPEPRVEHYRALVKQFGFLLCSF